MDTILKKLYLLLAIIVGVCVFCSCSSGELKTNKKYTYETISFEKASSLKFEDVQSLCPSVSASGKNITSVSELQKYIKENIDSYSIIKATENGNERIFLKCAYEQFEFFDTLCEVAQNGNTQEYEYAKSTDNVINLTKDGTEFEYELKFEKGKITYKIELAKGFSIKYYFK